MTLYEFNQAGYNSLPNMTYDEIVKSKKVIFDFLDSHKSDYYIMVNNDKNYYTVYTYKKSHNATLMASTIIDVAKTLGNIKSIEINGDMIEFWITPFQESECIMFAFFDYKKGVIEV